MTTSAYFYGGLLALVALAALAWALVYWDIAKRKLKLDEDAQFELKTRVGRFEKELQQFRETASTQDRRLNESLERDQGIAERVNRSIAAVEAQMDKHIDRIAELAEHEKNGAVRLSALEQAMREMGNPKPQHVARERVMPFGRK